MKKFIIYMSLAGIIAVCLYSAFVKARLSSGAMAGMAGSPTSSQSGSSGLSGSTGNSCHDLQLKLKQKSVVSTYISLRQGNYSRQDFGSECILTYSRSEGLNGYVDLAYSNFSQTTMNKVNLYNAMLNGVNFSEADLTDANLKRSNAGALPIILQGATLKGADMSLVYFYGANLQHAQAQQANFSTGKLAHANFSYGNFQNAIFSGALLTDITAIKSDFSNASFTGATVSGNISGAIFTNARGVTGAAFMNLYYYDGYPPVGLPDQVMQNVTKRTMPSGTSISSGSSAVAVAA